MKVCSIFSQVLKLFSRGEFEKAVKEHKADPGATLPRNATWHYGAVPARGAQRGPNVREPARTYAQFGMTTGPAAGISAFASSELK